MPRNPSLTPLVLAAMASQALLVVLAPVMVAVGRDLDAPVGAVGQARSVTAAVAIAASLIIATRIARVGVARLLTFGGAVALVASAAVAAAPNLGLFLAAHVLVGLAFACLLSAGFAGVAAFPAERRASAVGRVASGNAAAWIVVNPIAGALAGRLTWRAAELAPAAIALAALVTARLAAAGSGAPDGPRLRVLLAHREARRWIGAEVVAYGAWTALLTFAGAFFADRIGLGEGAVSWLLAAGAAAYLAASVRSATIVRIASARIVVSASALVLAALLLVELAATRSALAAAAVFSLLGLAAGIRTPAAAALGIEQVPDGGAGMMAARTAATQLGYLLGAVVGGFVVSTAGYGALGAVLGAGMAVSALLVLRVDDRVRSARPAPLTAVGSPTEIPQTAGTC